MGAMVIRNVRIIDGSGALPVTGDVRGIMGMPDELGRIEPGYRADLLMVNGNPLDDIKLLQSPANILLIMKDGVIHKGPTPHTA